MNSPEAPWRDLADRYSVQRKIGQGGMATVYLARDLRHDRDVALKVLKPEVASVMGVDRFLSEIAVVSRLNHPHIVPLFDSGETDGSLFYVMPYLKEPSLRDLLKREGQLPIDETMHLVGGMAAALSHAHEQGILHRDIKPENVMISGGEALVTDFGIALALTEAGGERLTETGMSVGTAEYMSPEQAMGETRLDERSDVYALASVVYEMLAGEPPFRGMNAQAVLARRLTESPRPLRTVRERVPVEMEQAILRALARTPADRPRTVDAFQEELETGWKTGTIAAVAPEEEGRAPSSGRGRRWAVALLVLIAAVLGAELWRASRADPGLPDAAEEIDADLVAVLPFAFSGGEDEDFLGDGVMTLLSGALSGAGELTTVDTRAVQSRVEALGGRAGEEVDRSLAASFGAGRFVSGTIADLGESIRIQARLAAVDPSEPGITATAEGPPGRVSALAEQIAVELITGLAGGGPAVNPSQVRVQLATGAGGSVAVLSDSLEALKAYLQGARDVREGRYNEAIPRFQRAVSIDPAFALAWHRLSTSAWAARLNEVAEAAGDSALTMIGRLSPRHAELVRAFAAYRGGRADEAEQGYREVVRRFPSEVEAWYMVGETQYHLGPLTGRPTREAIPAFEETLLLEPGHRSAMGHLAGLGVEIGDLEMADTLSTKYLELHPDADLAVWMEMIRATALGDSAVRASIHERLEPGAADPVEPLDMMFAAAFYRDFAWADTLAGRAADPSRDVMQRLSGLGYRAYVLTTRGRPGEAMEVLDRIDAVVPGLPLKVLFEAHLATLPHVPRDSARLAALVATLDALPAETPDVERQRLYARGRVAVALDDPDGARTAANRLEALAIDDPAQRHLEQARELRARALVAGTGTDGLEEAAGERALALLLDNRYRIEEVMSFEDPTASMIDARALTAELLDAQGRPEEALGWYASLADGVFPVNPVFEGPYLPWAYLRRARIHDAAGDADQALGLYSRFLDLVSGSERAFQPLVESARSRVADLGGG